MAIAPKPFRPREDPRAAIEKALDKAIALSPGTKRYAIADGNLLYEQHRRYRYVFTLEQSWDIPDGADLQLDGPGLEAPIPMELSGTQGESITITVGQRLPEAALLRATLVVERAWLLRKMKDAFIQSGTPAQLGLKLYGVLESVDGEAATEVVDAILSVFHPDPAQRKAIARALVSELLVIVGPPGTGKTDVLAAIALLHVVLFRHRVLISAHTNIAIDNAIVRVAKFCRRFGLEDFLLEERLVRFGDPHLAELEDEDYRTISLPLILAERCERNREDYARLERRRADLLVQIAGSEGRLQEYKQAWALQSVELEDRRKEIERELTALKGEEYQRQQRIQADLVALVERQADVKNAVDDATRLFQGERAALAPLEETFRQQQAARRALQNKLHALREMRPLVRSAVQFWNWEWQTDLEDSLEELTNSLSALEEQMKPMQARLRTLRRDRDRAVQQHQELIGRIADKQQSTTPPVAWNRQVKALEKKGKDLTEQTVNGNARVASSERECAAQKQELRLVEKELVMLDQDLRIKRREIAREVMDHAQVLGATLTSLYLNPYLLNQQWDVVIIDEGSMAPPPAVWVAASRATKHLIVVGDPLQLAPICKINDRDVKRWLGVDVYTHGGYTLSQARHGRHHSILLPYQSRMHTDICDLVRGPVYQGALLDRDPNAPRPKFGPYPDHAVVVCNTSGSGKARAERPKEGSRQNPYHVEVAVHAAKHMLASIEKPGAECIGIVTPYTAQRQRIKEKLQEEGLDFYVRVGTIHAFQGLEFIGLVFDTTESPQIRISRFTSDEWGTNAMRLLNVAITRARHKLLIIANMDYILEEPPQHLLPRIMELACKKKCVTSEELMSLPLTLLPGR